MARNQLPTSTPLPPPYPDISGQAVRGLEYGGKLLPVVVRALPLGNTF